MTNKGEININFQDQKKGKINNNNKQLHLKEVLMQDKVLVIIKLQGSLLVIKILLKQLITLFNKV